MAAPVPEMTDTTSYERKKDRKRKMDRSERTRLKERGR
jgi:hypothetical protein